MQQIERGMSLTFEISGPFRCENQALIAGDSRHFVLAAVGRGHTYQRILRNRSGEEVARALGSILLQARREDGINVRVMILDNDAALLHRRVEAICREFNIRTILRL